jgi:hypothetical protein
MKMKTLISVAAILAACGMVAGCFTSATAYTEKTNPDGTKTVSRVSVIGTGDKASQVAAEGLFADGTQDDLGAGVKTASANQKSTGIDGTLKGVGDLLGGIAAVMRAYPAVPTVTAAVDGGYTFAAATTYDTAPAEYNGVPGENGIGVYGRSGCGRCAAYAAAHPDIAIIDIADARNRADMWAALRARGYTGTSVALPVAVTADGFTQAAK